MKKYIITSFTHGVRTAKKSFPLMLVLCSAFLPAHAEVYLKQNRDSALPPAISTPSNPASPSAMTPSMGTMPQTNAAPAPQTAPTDIKTFARSYYQNCLEKNNPILDKNSQTKLCECSSQKLMQNMTIDEVKTMQEDTPQGQLDRNKMILQVYTPCIEYPAYALVNNSCVNNPQVKAVPGYQKICTCVSTNMAGYVRDNAPATIEKALRENPANLDPLRTMLESTEFNSASQAALNTCLQTNFRK